MSRRRRRTIGKARGSFLLKSQRINPKELRVLAPLYERAASGYYRVVMPLKTLMDQKRIQALWKDLFPIAEAKSDAEIQQVLDLMAQAFNWANVIFLEREDRADKILETIKKAHRHQKAVAMDIDDHVVSFPDIPYEKVANYWREHIPGFLAIMYEVDLLITTTDRLGETYKPYLAPGSDTMTIPNYIDDYHFRWKVNPEGKDGQLVIGWMGGPTHAHDLELVKEPLKVILGRHPNTVFKCVGLEPDWIKELPESQIIMDSGYSDLHEYPARFADFDIGLIPLIDNEFNRIGKSDLKFLEYSMFGIASIVSKVSAYWSTVRPKKTGLLVDNSPTSWIQTMETLIQNEDLRKQLGSKAREYTINYRSIVPNAYRWAEAFKKARQIRLKKLRSEVDVANSL